MSRSNTADTATRPTSSSTTVRIMVCDVPSAFSVRKRNSPWPAFFAFAGTTAAMTEMATNASRMSTVFHSARVDSKRAMASTGHSSPQVPYARMDSPTRVPVRPRSLRMGMSVPSAVVVSAMTSAMPSIWLTEKNGVKRTTRKASTMDTHQVASPRLPWLPVRLFGLIS